MKVSNYTKRILDECKPFLAQNDLHSMYDHLFDMYNKDEICEADIGGITELLEKCGIDTLEYFKREGYLPDYYLQSKEIPDSLYADVETHNIDGNSITIKAVKFPDEIKAIGIGAFESCKTSSLVLDLRGITDVGPYAFSWDKFISIIIDDSLQYVGQEAFYNTNIMSIVIPRGRDADEVRALFEASSINLKNVAII